MLDGKMSNHPTQKRPVGRPRIKHPMRTYSIVLPEKLADRIDDAAWEADISRAKWIRDAAIQRLEREESGN